MTNNARKTLPENVIPLTYDLSLEPDLDTFTFDGEVQIFVELKNATDEITLNAAELTIHSSSVQIDDDIIDGGSLQSDDDETITINLGKRYDPGKATVNISFSGELNDRLLGFYRSQYTDVNEKQSSSRPHNSNQLMHAEPSPVGMNQRGKLPLKCPLKSTKNWPLFLICQLLPFQMMIQKQKQLLLKKHP